MQARKFMVVIILALVAYANATSSCPEEAEEYRIALRGDSKFSIDANGTCHCARFVSDDGSSSGGASSAALTQLQADLASLQLVVNGLVDWGRLNSVCVDDNDCRRLYSCDPQLLRCRASLGSACTSTSECVIGSTCSSGTCAGAAPPPSTTSAPSTPPSPLVPSTTSAVIVSSTTGVVSGETIVGTSDQLYSFGANSLGQLGQNKVGDFPSVYLPRPVAKPAAWNNVAVKNVFGGNAHVLVQMADLSLWAWGSCASGQLGINVTGPFEKRSVPVQVQAPAGLVGQEIVASGLGWHHSLVLTAGGDLYGWGQNANGQLGDGTTVPKSVPTLVVPSAFAGSPVRLIAATASYSMAVLANNNVYYWGFQPYGNGDGTNTVRSVPTLISHIHRAPGETIRSIAVGTGALHVMLVTSAGNVWVWGSNMHGQLGDGTFGGYRYNATRLIGPAAWATDKVVSLAQSYYHSAAMTASGAVYFWGRNLFGAFGNGDTMNQTIPTLFVPPASWASSGLYPIAVRVISETSLIQLSDKSLWSFGKNEFGELGANVTGIRTTPVPVMRLASWGVRDIVNWVVGDNIIIVQLASP